jgi:hypothetical protein
MSATSTIAAIGSAQCREFISHEMLVASPAMSAATKYPYLVNKIAFFQNRIFIVCCKNIL